MRLHKRREHGHGHHGLHWCSLSVSLSTVLLLIAAALLYGTLALHSAAERQHKQTGHLLPTFHLRQAPGALQGLQWGAGHAAAAAPGGSGSSSGAVLDVPGYAGPPYVLPKLIHQTVKDKAAMSCEVQDAVQSWIDLNPGYAHTLYDDADLLAFVQQHYPELTELFQALPTNIERTDTWRYLVLHKFGGVYADSDVKCMQPVSTWNQEHGYDAALLVGIAKRNTKTGATSEFNQFVMAAMPGHPVLAAMPTVIAANLAHHHLQGGPLLGQGKKHDNQILMRTGPKAFTSAIQAYAARVGAPWPVNSTLADQQGGVLFGSVRAMPKFALGMGWDTLDHNMTCEQVKASIRPEALICHQFFGSWKAKPEAQLKDRKLTYGDCGPGYKRYYPPGGGGMGQGQQQQQQLAQQEAGLGGGDGGEAAADAAGEGTVEVVGGGEDDAGGGGFAQGSDALGPAGAEDAGGALSDLAAAGGDEAAGEGEVEVVRYTDPDAEEPPQAQPPLLQQQRQQQ